LTTHSDIGPTVSRADSSEKPRKKSSLSFLSSKSPKTPKPQKPPKDPGWKLQERLHHGTQSSVYVACKFKKPVHMDSHILAAVGRQKTLPGTEKVVKIAPRKKAERAALEHEGEILLKLDHPNIIHVTPEVDRRGKRILVMEQLKGGDLMSFIDKIEFMPISEVRQILKPVVQALVYMHGKNIIHRDLKPENIMLKFDEKSPTPQQVPTPILIDFGFALDLNDKGDRELLPRAVGTSAYMPLELVAENFPQTDKDAKALDVFSLGITMFTVAINLSPPDSKDWFEKEDKKDKKEKEKEKDKLYEFVFKSLREIKSNEGSEDLVQEFEVLVRKMLKLTPGERPTMEEVLDDPFFK